MEDLKFPLHYKMRGEVNEDGVISSARELFEMYCECVDHVRAKDVTTGEIIFDGAAWVEEHPECWDMTPEEVEDTFKW